jgi:hypothetical protein
VRETARSGLTAALERSMTWVAILFDFKGEPPPASSLKSPNFTPPSMGLAGDIRQRISFVWPGIDWTSNKCYYQAENAVVLVKLSLETAADHEPAEHVMLELGYSGRYSPYAALERLCTINRWSIYDTEIDQFLHFPNPDQSGRLSVRRRAAAVVRNLRRGTRDKDTDRAL